MAEEKKGVIVSVEKNDYLPVLLQGKFPVVNSKATHAIVEWYTDLETMVSERGAKYIIAKKNRRTWGWKGFDGAINFTTALPRGTIIAFVYRTGSHSKAYHTYAALFVVREGEGDITLEDTTNGEDVVVHVKNLQRIQRITEEDHARIAAHFHNSYGAKPSQYDPVTTLYYYWVEKGLAQPPKPTPPPPPPAAEEGEPFELSISAPAATPAPVAAPAPAPAPAAVPTAVDTVTTPAP
ncbi:MAG: hypothetical protein QW517_09720, partial [Thermofilaceae archaeon]